MLKEFIIKIFLNFINLTFSEANMSKLIIFSGIDGSGKSSQIELIKKYLKKRKIKYVTIWSRGGYTPCFLLIKSIIRKIFGKKNIPEGNSLRRDKLFKNNFIKNLWLNIAIIDLIIYWCFYLRYKMNFIDIIICDRYILDTFIDFKINFPEIQFEHNIFWQILSKIIIKPDLSIFLNISFKKSRKRLLGKFEPYPDSLQKAQQRYELYFKYRNQYNYTNINSNFNIEKVSNNLIRHINTLIN